MKTIADWAVNFAVNDRPWLLLGKGPSFSMLRSEMKKDFHFMGLNHVSRHVPVALAHFIDLDAFLNCLPGVLSMAQWVVMPWHPHENFSPSAKTLARYASEVPELGALNSEGRLLTYNLSTADDLSPLEGAPRIDARFFSAEAGLNLLAACGVRDVRSLGVDGGADYARQFQDIAAKTRLANGHQTFDLQFEGIARTIRQTGVHYAPLFVDSPARIFLDEGPTQTLPAKVLEFSVKKYATLSVEFHRIEADAPGAPGEPGASSVGFPRSRFGVPRMCGYSGRAICLEADMQVFVDLMDLWTRPFGGASVLYARHDTPTSRLALYSVLVLNCAELDWDATEIVAGLADGRLTVDSLICPLGVQESQPGGLPAEWNSLDTYVHGETRLLHYTEKATQPWVSHRSRYSDLWLGDLAEALAEGFIAEEFLLDQVERGHISPELPGWLGMYAASGRWQGKGGPTLANGGFRRENSTGENERGQSRVFSRIAWAQILGRLRDRAQR